MTPRELVEEIKRRRLTVERRGDTLHVGPAKDARGLEDAIRAHKLFVMEYFSKTGGCRYNHRPVWVSRWGCRRCGTCYPPAPGGSPILWWED